MTLPSAVLDPARLDALRATGLLDTPPEPGFDDVVMLAQELCGTSAALVSLVSADRQWFKARSGFEPCETPIGQSVCAYALAGPGLLVIPDLRADARTRDNLLVTGEPHLRFYAGAPLATGSGEIIGTLCVLDGKPRPDGLTPAQGTALRALARQVMVLVEMRRAVTSRDDALSAERQAGDANLVRALASERDGQQSQIAVARATAAQEAGRIGTFDLDLATDVLQCSAELCRLYGLPEQPSYPVSVLSDRVVDDDRALGSSTASRADGSAPLEIELRVRRADDGALRWIARRGAFARDAAGRPVRFTGTVFDITERKLAELRQTALLALGEDLRNADTAASIKASASRALGAMLDASRLGYAEVDEAAGTLDLAGDWTATGLGSLAGTHPSAVLINTIRRMRDGSPLCADDLDRADWVGDDLARYASLGTRAQIGVPVLERGVLVGLLFVHAAAPRAWNRDEVDFTRAVADRVHAALAKVRAEEEQRVLNQELGHRLKNTLAMVQAIASQTLRGIADREAVDAFRQRLMALGRAHDVLLQRSWASARIRAVVDGTLALHADAARFDLAGPDLSLAAKAALSLTLLIHELATNALKYGALSADGGRVALGWSVDHAVTPPVLVMVWREAGGPPVVQPGRRGFGSRLIAIGLAGTGRTRLRYDPDGFSAEFRAPLPLVTEP